MTWILALMENYSVSFNIFCANVVSCSSDLTIKLWDSTNAYAILKTLHGHDHTISSVRFVPPRGDLAVSCSRDRSIKVWDVLSGYCVRTISGAHNDWIRKVSSSDDGALYLSAGNDQVKRLATLLRSRLLVSGMHKVKARKVNTS